MDIALVFMLVFGGLFTGNITMIAWNRGSAWENMPDKEFAKDFAETLRIADKLQPILLVLTLTSTLWFAMTSDGSGQFIAFVAVLALAIILVLSLAILVPLQKRLVAAYQNDAIDKQQFYAMRQRWLTGHTGRSALSIIALLLIVAAASWR